MADQLLDLLGDPIPPEHEGPGRPPHVPSDKNRCKIILLFADGKSIGDVALALGLDRKTLRKHYSPQLRMHRAAGLVVDGEVLLALSVEAAKGNVSAMKEMLKRRAKQEIAVMADKVAHRGSPKKEPALGKKAAAKKAAGEMGGRFGRREAPPGMMVQ